MLRLYFGAAFLQRLNFDLSSLSGLFEPSLAMFRPRGADGKWLEPFDQFAWGGDYTEAGVGHNHRSALTCRINISEHNMHNILHP